MAAVVSESLLRYRPWRGESAGPLWASWALARTSFRLMLRKKAFWVLFALAAMIFFFFFYGQYLIVWVGLQAGRQSVSFAGIPVKLDGLSKFLDRLNLNGSPHTFGNVIWFEGYIVSIVLALAGSVLVGNDFHHGSLPFYLAKPIARRHYILGKCLAVGLLVNLLSTLPAFVLYVQAGMLYDWKTYYIDHLRQLVGIFAYGLLLTGVLGLLLMAVAVNVRKAVPLVMIWMGLFVLLPLVGRWLVEGPQFSPLWRLIDLWNDLYLVGLWLLDADFKEVKVDRNPTVLQAAVALCVVAFACWLVLRRRVTAIDVIA
jgi:ABC-type transport system involved in multi-copper enzyme maturation permease subunit